MNELQESIVIWTKLDKELKEANKHSLQIRREYVLLYNLKI